MNSNRKVFPAAKGIDKRLSMNYNKFMIYKVVETSMVTDDDIEKILNLWTGQGYSFESIHFVTAESSRRPQMAFLFFIQNEPQRT